MLKISESTARAVVRVLEDILDLDSRAGCSDKYFRQHFVTVARVPPVQDALEELRAQLDDKAAEQGGFVISNSPAGASTGNAGGRNPRKQSVAKEEP